MTNHLFLYDIILCFELMDLHLYYLNLIINVRSEVDDPLEDYKNFDED